LKSVDEDLVPKIDEEILNTRHRLANKCTLIATKECFKIIRKKWYGQNNVEWIAPE